MNHFGIESVFKSTKIADFLHDFFCVNWFHSSHNNQRQMQNTTNECPFKNNHHKLIQIHLLFSLIHRQRKTLKLNNEDRLNSLHNVCDHKCCFLFIVDQEYTIVMFNVYQSTEWVENIASAILWLMSHIFGSSNLTTLVSLYAGLHTHTRACVRKRSTTQTAKQRNRKRKTKKRKRNGKCKKQKNQHEHIYRKQYEWRRTAPTKAQSLRKKQH